jgi:hypothetical protein
LHLKNQHGLAVNAHHANPYGTPIHHGSQPIARLRHRIDRNVRGDLVDGTAEPSRNVEEGAPESQIRPPESLVRGQAKKKKKIQVRPQGSAIRPGTF